MEMTTAIDGLAALAHPTRLAAFRLLVRAGPNGLPAGELAAATATGASTLSAHLAKLEAAGVVASRRAGRQILYAVQIESVRRLLAYLVEDCCAGQAALCGGLADLVCCEEETLDA